MGLIDQIPQAHSALAHARTTEADRIAAALRSSSIVGVLGEAEVGKTATVSQALAQWDSDVIRLDLDSAASDSHVGFLLMKGLAKAIVAPSDFSLLSAGALLPSSAERARTDLAQALGLDGLDEALRRWPSGNFSSSRAMEAVERVSRRKQLVLWMDHLEAPSLTPRHPVKVGRLLWGVREVVQRQRSLRVVLTAREAFSPQLLGSRAAFHQQGGWISLDNPDEAAWREVARRLDLPWGVARDLAEQLRGHPATVLQALLVVNRSGLAHPYALLQELVARDDGLTGRAIQHARTLHRLGGQIMSQIALGEHPYGVSERGASSPQEVRKVLDRLRLAGLLRRRKGWAIVNPLVEMRLRGAVRSVSDPVFGPMS